MNSRQVGEPNRPKVPHIHPNVELAAKRLQSAVAMAMQVDRALTHVPPSTKRVVTEHKQRFIDRQFRIWLDTLPLDTFGHCHIVVVTSNKMLAPVQYLQQRRYALYWLANGEITQVPDFVFWFDHFIPTIYQHPIHLAD
jgi:hypothetical protein